MRNSRSFSQISGFVPLGAKECYLRPVQSIYSTNKQTNFLFNGHLFQHGVHQNKETALAMLSRFLQFDGKYSISFRSTPGGSSTLLPAHQEAGPHPGGCATFGFDSFCARNTPSHHQNPGGQQMLCLQSAR